MQNDRCPVCINSFFTRASVGTGDWGYRVDCPICGRFDLEREAEDDLLNPLSHIGRRLVAVDRARIAHKIRTATTPGPSGLPRLNSDFLKRYIDQGCPAPSPGEQAINAIRYIGDEVALSGERLQNLPEEFFAIIGAPSPTFAGELLFEMVDKGLIDGHKRQNASVAPQLLNINLTLNGWQTYESEKKGKFSGKHGFLAMKFGDKALDPLARDVIKPTLKQELGFDLLDMRDIARAGVIDNIMRAQIRDAAFVIVDLTHDNSGAYWEAGYAEGLGKPVVYICEKQKFDKAQTHFDTNHCTTVVWAEDELDQFKLQLVATLRRSLNLF